jgi:arabinogalactan oligomer/maltooligosaccharide transport system permease protein
MYRRNNLASYGFLSPLLISITILSFFPMVYTIYIAFTNFNLNHFDQFQFVGLANFKTVMAGEFFKVFWPVFIWTFLYAILATFLTYIIGMSVALLLNNKYMKETNIYRGLFMIPYAIPGTIAILAWSGILNGDYGFINQVLHIFGIPKVPWLTDPFWAKVSIIGVSVWLGFPYTMQIILGALQAIPQELYEAAEVDGAGKIQRFRSITFPGVLSTSLPFLISGFAYNFNNFGAQFFLTGGGPPRTDTSFAGYTDILVSAAYKMTLTFNRYDLAATLSIVMFVIVGAISLINMRLTGAFKEAD